MNDHLQILAQLSNFNIWDNENQKMEQMHNSREDMMNILSFIDFEKLCHVIKCFLNQIKSLGKNK